MKQKIRIWLLNFFGFSRTEANGFIILTFLLVLILTMPFLSKKVYSLYQPPLQSQKDKKQLNSLLSMLEKNNEIKKEEKREHEYKAFDLNKSNAQQLISSGFPEYLAERIVKYREKVKPFESKDELLKIYGIDSNFYQKVYPYIKFSKIKTTAQANSKTPKDPPSKLEEKPAPPEEPVKKRIENFDLNQADSTQLQKIYGIGPAYSQRIIKYRNYLGGFHSLAQLEEVYGMKKENIDSLKKYVFIDTKINLKQLKVNQLNADSLVQHPYISYKEANMIVNYRKQHGNFKSVSDLLAIKVLDSTWVKKVTPYLTFD